MERQDLGKGRFLITHTPEEIQELKRGTGISFHLSLAAVAISRKGSTTNPQELQEINDDIKMHLEAADRLMSEPVVNGHETSNDPISEEERQIGGIVHGVVNENLPIEEAEARLKLIAELNSSNHPVEDK